MDGQTDAWMDGWMDGKKKDTIDRQTGQDRTGQGRTGQEAVINPSQKKKRERESEREREGGREENNFCANAMLNRNCS